MTELHSRSRSRADLSDPRRLRSRVAFGLLVILCWLPISSEVQARRGDGADGRFERRESLHFTLYQDVDLDEYGGFNGSRRFERAVLKELEDAFDRLDRILGLRPKRKLEVRIWDPAIFDRRFSGLFRFRAAGFYGQSIQIRGDTRVTPALVRVLHHELVHAAFDAEAPRLVLPAWMNEGIAEWFEARALGKRALSDPERTALVQLARSGGFYSLAQLSAPSLAGFSADAAAFAYLESYGFINYLVETHGEEDLIRFWSALVRSRSLERASRRAFGRSLEKLEAEFRRAMGAG